MNIKKITAPTMPEAMKKIKLELGENAVILNSKVIYHGGFLGMFRKKSIEVIAALDEVASPSLQIKRNKDRKTPTLKEESLENNRSFEATFEKEKNDTALLAEMAHLKEEIRSIRQRIEVGLQHYPDLVQSCLSTLQEAELSEKHILSLGDTLANKWRNAQMNVKQDDVIQWAKQAIIKELNKVSFTEISSSQKFVNFVGPTGVGKTTTIAKLAAEAVLEHKKRAALITTDTYRIAAIEQLKTYAELLNIPIEIIYEEKDFLAAVQKFSDYDVVFIDTAGRNYREKRFISELKKLFGHHHEIETFLVLSLSMKEKDISKIVDNFLDMNFNKFIFTKADETNSYGVMYNLINKYNKGVSYITNGQDVPDDIIAATPEVITRYLFKDEKS